MSEMNGSTESTVVVNTALRAGAGVTITPTYNLSEFLNETFGIIGRTASTRSEPNTSSEFNFWVGDRPDVQGRLEIGSIVAARADSGDDITFGVVMEMRSYSDTESFIADFLSHDFGAAEREVPTDISQVVVVTCAVMRNLTSTTKPVGRSRVYFPTALGIQFAYGIVDADGNSIFAGAPIPIGVFENADGTIAPVSVDENFLVGPEGAHLNVSGISGLAAKTSAVEFVIKSLLTHSGKRIAIVMFNVKSRDLLYVDQCNPRALEDAWSRKIYDELGIALGPLENCRFFAPGSPVDPKRTQSKRELPVEKFTWDLQQIYHDIPSLFSSFDWDDRMEGVWFVIQSKIEQGPLLSYAQMMTWINGEINNASRSQQQWLHGNHVATWNKMKSHLQRFPNVYKGLITGGGTGQDISWSEMTHNSVFIIDIQMLRDRGQRLVFSRAIREVSQRLEQGISDIDAVVVFVDELNKFGPSGNERSPLKSFLIDVTARGRSMGMVLFGAEQFASAVDKEITENSSTFLIGRTEANELRSANYSALSTEIKTKLMTLPQGHLLAKFAKFPQPIFVRFPYPPCLPGDQWQGSDDLHDTNPA
jgi:hypothetical protein